ncbi:unnamed protein product [Pedinophyceae sp. YPF-701]|nr:unnamed protein product [Pedinophyceae sp. YPF-701]
MSAADEEEPQVVQIADVFGSDSEEEDAGGAESAGAAAEGGGGGEGDGEAGEKGEDGKMDVDGEEAGEGAAEGGEERPGPPLGPPLRIRAPLLDVPRAGQYAFMVPGNLTGVQSVPFSVDSYEPEHFEYIDDTGRRRERKAPMAMIRWRWGRDGAGNPVPEGNARVVRWSDGSRTLIIGEEVFAMQEHDVIDPAFLVARLGGGVLQPQAMLDKRANLRLLKAKHLMRKPVTVTEQERARVRTGDVDANRQAMEELAMAEEAARAREKLAKQQQKLARKYQARKPARPAALTANFLEGDDDPLEEEEEVEPGLERPQMDEIADAARAHKAAAAKREAAQAARARKEKSKRRKKEEERGADDASEDLDNTDGEEEEGDDDGRDLEGFINDDDDEVEEEEGGEEEEAEEEAEAAGEKGGEAAAAGGGSEGGGSEAVEDEGAVRKKRRVVLDDDDE